MRAIVTGVYWWSMTISVNLTFYFFEQNQIAKLFSCVFEIDIWVMCSIHVQCFHQYFLVSFSYIFLVCEVNLVSLKPDSLSLRNFSFFSTQKTNILLWWIEEERSWDVWKCLFFREVFFLLWEKSVCLSVLWRLKYFCVRSHMVEVKHKIKQRFFKFNKRKKKLKEFKSKTSKNYVVSYSLQKKPYKFLIKA